MRRIGIALVVGSLVGCDGDAPSVNPPDRQSSSGPTANVAAPAPRANPADSPSYADPRQQLVDALMRDDERRLADQKARWDVQSESLRTALDEANRRQTSAGEALQVAKSVLEQANRDLDASELRYDEVKTQYLALRAALKETTEPSAEQVDDVQTLEDLLTGELAGTIGAGHSAVDAAQASVEESEREVADADATIVHLKADMAEIDANIAAANEQLEAERGAVSDLAASLPTPVAERMTSYLPSDASLDVGAEHLADAMTEEADESRLTVFRERIASLTE
ncbi:MAG: hypothetical protein AAF493_15110 [Pseudomonadota bacterium]